MSEPGKSEPKELIRGIGLPGAISLNMIDMIGVGPFITIPLIISAMGGPQAIVGWIVGALLVICDGLVWAELGAAMPRSGGSYRYLKEMYGPDSFGKLMAFLFIWQLTFSAPLSIASGCIGLAQYAGYLLPSLKSVIFHREVVIPFFTPLNAGISITGGTFVAMGIVLLAIAMLYRNITVISRISGYLWIGVMITVGWTIFGGMTHFNASRAFAFPPGAFAFDVRFLNGLGAGMLVAVYDYWGYYNVCFLGGEIREPSRTIPRAIVFSIVFVAAIYLTMNISILGVIPWEELSGTASSDARRYVVAVFMQRLYGDWGGIAATILIMWTAFASVFSLLLGYSRVPYAAALEGDFFAPFARLHAKHRFPYVSLLVLGGAAMLFCSLSLSDVIAALVVIRISVQFLSQTLGIVILRRTRPDFPRPFRMWLYPLPAILAFCGFLYVLVMRNNFGREVWYAVTIVCAGVALFLLRSKQKGEWPFKS